MNALQRVDLDLAQQVRFADKQIDAIEAEAFGPVRSILHIGIGGSALGPDLLVDALGREAGRYEVAVVSNVDGVALETALDRFDPQTTLVAIASKTFTPPRPCSMPRARSPG